MYFSTSCVSSFSPREHREVWSFSSRQWGDQHSLQLLSSIYKIKIIILVIGIKCEQMKLSTPFFLKKSLINMAHCKRIRLKPVLHTKAGVWSKILATYVATSFDTVRATCIFELAALQQKTQKDSLEHNLDNSYEMPTDLIPRSNLSGLIPGGKIISASIRQGFIKHRRKANTRKNFSKHM